MTVSRSFWQNIQQYSWLVFGLICLFFALVFWAITSSDHVVEVEKQQDIAETQTQIQPQKVTATANLGTLSNQVKPLDLTMRVVTAGNHEAEFRGTKFIEANQKNWTIEVFRSSDEDIIKNYLKMQQDRSQFMYFRLTGANQEEQYVLVYGNFNRETDAKNRLAQLNLKLPNSVKPHILTFAQYVGLVNDLGTDEITEGSGKLYGVVLRNAPVPVAPARPVAAPANNSAVTTTITRRDDQGNVVDIQRHGASTPNSAPTSPNNNPTANVNAE